MNHKIIVNNEELQKFLDFLPDEGEDEQYFMSLMARDKTKKLPPVKDGQIHGSKRFCRKADILSVLRSYELPVGSYSRKGVTVTDEHLCPYITINPRCNKKAFKLMALETVSFAINGKHKDPVGFAMSCLHRSVGKKNFFDFDFDFPLTDQFEILIKSAFDSYTIIHTRGGFHLAVRCQCISSHNTSQFKDLISKADQTGCANMIPIPGCNQRGFTPYINSFTN